MPWPRAAPSPSWPPAARPTSPTTRRPVAAHPVRCPDRICSTPPGPCRAEITQLQKVYDATRNEGVAFLGINVRDNDIDAPRDFVSDRGITFDSIYDPAMRTMIAFGGKYPTTVIPSTVVLDRQHRVAAVFLRELIASDLLPVVQRLAAEQ